MEEGCGEQGGGGEQWTGRDEWAPWWVQRKVVAGKTSRIDK